MQRRETEHGTVEIPISHVTVDDPHCVPDGFLPTRDHKNARRLSRSRVARRASATSQRNRDHDGVVQISFCMIITVLEGAMNEDMETHTMSTVAMMTMTTRATVRTAVMMSTAQLNSGTHARNLSEKNDDDVFDYEDEEVHALTLEESGALGAVSKSNRTLAQAHQPVKDARSARKPTPRRPRHRLQRQHVERKCFLCRARLSRSD